MSGEREYLETTVEPQPDDSADLRWALETALAMWARGSREQTLKWLHTAMQTASKEGRHDRAYSLGRVLSDLEHRPLPARRSTKPPPPVPGPQSITTPLSGGTSPMAQGASRPGKSLLQTAPYRIAPEEVTSHVAVDTALLEACQPSAPELLPEREAAQSITDVPVPEVLKVPPDRPRPPTVMTDGLDATLTNVRSSASGRDSVERTVVMSVDELMAPSARSHGPPTTQGSPQRALEPLRALRVAVVAGQGRELVLRLLDDGEAPADGAQEALLVPFAR
ncbi:MAG: hypothetical protein IT375_09415 [Polyangiaceae bacterium]|nr:hypothetical protein [Polyangiaceae bacterium]MCK6531699.1 hypothetical protein [Polyangiaceae bacterium]